ncbi:MAG: methyltransferase domain-containing protein [Deltaproteobacteria bacterium]|nr:methyltransferase domain-containing protein [Deltaproteobacteria bacterium]
MTTKNDDDMSSHDVTLAAVKDYYGRVLERSQDLKTNACCTADSMPVALRQIAAKIHPEVLERFYGCGSPLPQGLDGQTVVDLGCGSGRDAFIASALVGPSGRVIGVDMTESQIAVARKHSAHMATALGYSRENTSFRTGYIEDLWTAGLEDNSVDVVISNCVVNLSPDKNRVMREIFRVLKPGGELYFSDIFSGRRIPQALVDDPVLYGECLSGALYIEDFRRALRAHGVLDWRTVNRRRISIANDVLERKVGNVDFWSMTVRAFKLDLEDICEDYGQVATYRGTLADSATSFLLDDHHSFETGRPMIVCGNTADMVSKTRFAAHFTVQGDKTTHFGPFDCSPGTPSSAVAASRSCC